MICDWPKLTGKACGLTADFHAKVETKIADLCFKHLGMFVQVMEKEGQKVQVSQL